MGVADIGLKPMEATQTAPSTDSLGYENRINWDDLDRTDQPGEYQLQGYVVIVTLGEIEIWEDHPDASFALVAAKDGGLERYSLGMPNWEISSPGAPNLPP